MTNTKRRKGACNFRGVTKKAVRKNIRLPKGFDLYDLKYVKPKTRDLAVGLVYFNCVKSKRLLMNYLYVLEKFKMADIPTYTIEMYEDTPEIHDAIHVKTEFILFQKERLCHLLEKHIPESYTKLLFIDCDLVFENLNWYNEISEKLKTNNIVQPFSKGVWLDITYRKIVKQRVPFVFYTKLGPMTRSGELGGYHPGFAWAFQRSWFKSYGFFQESILGGGDSISSSLWVNYDMSDTRPFLANAMNAYKDKLDIQPSICFIEGNIFHLWHGDRKNRQYVERRDIFAAVKDIRDILKTDKNGLYALKDDTLKPKIRKYFRNRDDDGLAMID